MTDHKATPEQWAALEEQSAPEYDNTILELRARVEQLEANRPEKPDSSDPAGSLVERLAKTIYGPSNIQEGWRSEARAAIREVAAWMTSNPDVYFPPALVFALEHEAER